MTKFTPVQEETDEDDDLYWGWIETGTNFYQVIKNCRSSFCFCFPGSPFSAIDAGDGQIVKLRITPIEGQ